jgi:RHH-type proline utilization regulon transcriptional repressor/proline dehydrogenase/delta 1-pyrroline-5-carboxylate dehydrogenase
LALSENIQVRIYAPVGSHEDLLPYLVRRLLENGANSSFVHQLSDEDVNIDELSKRPLDFDNIDINARDKAIPLPLDIFGKRKNSSGFNLDSMKSREQFLNAIAAFNHHSWISAPMINGETLKVGDPETVFSPFDHRLSVGSQYDATAELAMQALVAADQAFPEWLKTPVAERSKILEATADLLEQNSAELMALCQREAGKFYQDCIDEVREAVDFCRYYAQQAGEKFAVPISLVGPTGESNQLTFEGRGVFVCISPWNFPLAIFMGQIAAALVSGNTIIVKPAETTSLVAYRAIQLLFDAGLPKQVLQFVPGPGSKLGAVLNASPLVSGVVFTGSNATARAINLTLANRDLNAGIATLIAETGGLNAMLVDSTSLPEQVARDVVRSAFASAGQRCSALRVLYVQNDIADRLIDLIKGMMSELSLGNPQLLKTDIGPVIDSNAQKKLLDYIEKTKANCKDFFQTPVSEDLTNGTFVAPALLEINSITEMQEEQFGPILHVVRYAVKQLDQVVDDINAKGYGLTCGIHTRNTSIYEKLASRLKVGNIYINRDQVGAVVGVNPFGGCGLSGTGPKAGGPHYLLRFATEKTVTNNTAAIGGNIDLLNG